jgi:hypothetical protein
MADFPSANSVSFWMNSVVNGITVISNTNTVMNCAPTSVGCTVTALVYSGGFSWYNYKVRMNFAFSTNGGNVGLAFNWQSQSYYYEYLLSFSGDRMLRKIVNNTIVNLWSYPLNIGAFSVGTYQNVEVEIKYGKIRVWNEGILVANPVYDSSWTSGSVAVTSGNGAIPYFDFVSVQQHSVWIPNPMLFRVFINARDTYSLYLNGVLRSYMGGMMVGAQSVGEYFLPYTSSASLAVYASQSSGNPYIMVRAPWMGIDSNNKWYCATGFNKAWIVVGYNVTAIGSPFSVGALNTFGNPLSGFNYGPRESVPRDPNPSGIWTLGVNGVYDASVTCVLSSISPLSSEPTVQPTTLPSFSLAPGSPYPFDYNSWSKIDVPGYGGVAGVWNTAGPATVPSSPLGTGGILLDSSTGGSTAYINTDLTVQGQFQVYRFAYNFTSYSFSTNAAICGSAQNGYTGIVWAFTDVNNYYEYVISYSEQYHSIRKHIAGVPSTVFISIYTTAPGSAYVPISLVMGSGSFSLTTGGVNVYTGLLNPSLPSGSFGFHVAKSTCGYFYNTAVSFFAPLAGAGGNAGSWTLSNNMQSSSSATAGMVTESSNSGSTGASFYAFPNWSGSWLGSGLPGQRQVAGWYAKVSVSLSSTGNSADFLGLAFYVLSASNYYEFVINAATNTMFLRQRGAGGVLVSTLCSVAVTPSSTAAQSRALQLSAFNGFLNAYIDGVLLCSVADPNYIAALPLASMGSVALISSQTASTSIFTNLAFQWIPPASQDTGACGTAFCPCYNGGTCTTGVAWSTATCVCTSLWSGSTCLIPKLTLASTLVQGSGVTGSGAAIGANMAINITAFLGVLPTLSIDAYFASAFVVTLSTTNGLNITTTSVLPVRWLGTNTSSFVTNYTLPACMSVSVSITVNGAAVGAGNGVYSYNMPTTGFNALKWAVSGSGITGTTMSSLSYINLISYDSSGNEFTGSSAHAAGLTANVAQDNAPSSLILTFIYSGTGGRYRASYTPTVIGHVKITISDSTATPNLLDPLTGNPWQFTIAPASLLVLPVLAPSSKVPVYFKWNTSSTAIAAGLTVMQYNFYISEETQFVALIAARYTTVPPAVFLPIVLNPGVQYYFKVTARTLDPFTGLQYDIDLSTAEYTFQTATPAAGQ